MTVYGYARVSTIQQDLSLQVQALKDYGVDPANIYTDKLTGANMHRESLNKLLDLVQEGDLIIVNKLDRLGRSVSQVTTLIDKLNSEKIYVKSIADNIDTSNDSAMSKAMLHLLAMFSEMERNFIQERTKPAIENAKAKGVAFGRPESSKKIYRMAIEKFLEGGVSLNDLVREFGKNEKGKDIINEPTFFRKLREYKMYTSAVHEHLEKGTPVEDFVRRYGKVVVKQKVTDRDVFLIRKFNELLKEHKKKEGIK